jgi:hypothetical protein
VARVCAFVFVPKNLTGEEMTVLIAESLPQMQPVISKTQHRFILRLYRDRSLKAIRFT